MDLAFQTIGEGIRAVSETAKASRDMNAKAIARMDQEQSRLDKKYDDLLVLADKIVQSNEDTIFGFKLAYGALVEKSNVAVGQIVEGRKDFERTAHDTLTQFRTMARGPLEEDLSLPWAHRKYKVIVVWVAERSWPYIIRFVGWSSVAFFSWIKAAPAIVEAFKALFGL